MKPEFSIDVDVPRSLVRITMSGFFEPEDIGRFVAARDLAHRQLTCGRNEHLTLVDIRGMHIQSQESVGQFAKLLGNPQFASKCIAFVVTQSLARMQIQRAAAGRGAGFFIDDPVAAEQWLLADRLPEA
jgi:hypothetical protein